MEEKRSWKIGDVVRLRADALFKGQRPMLTVNSVHEENRTVACVWLNGDGDFKSALIQDQAVVLVQGVDEVRGGQPTDNSRGPDA